MGGRILWGEQHGERPCEQSAAEASGGQFGGGVCPDGVRNRFSAEIVIFLFGAVLKRL